MTQQAQTTRASAPYAVAAVAMGAVVALLLGVYGREHTPTGRAIETFGFGSLISMKVWLAVIAGGLAVVQLVTALWMFGHLRLRVPRGLAVVHRVSGTLTVLVSLPVAYHCLWSLGFQSYDTRVMVHSVSGCLFYGALVTKLIGLHGRRMPGWLVPLAGGLLLSLLVVVVWTSALWYVREVGWPSTSTGY